MRPIKFKAKRIDGKCWVEGHYFAIKDLSHWIKSKNYTHQVDPFTLCQFTGLYDKEGKEIWEGDIITADHYPYFDDGTPNYVGIIEYIFGGFQQVLKCVNHKKRGISDGINESIEETDYYTVIGNIHDKEE